MRHPRWMVMYLDACGIPTVYRAFNDYDSAERLAMMLGATIRDVWVAPNPDAVLQALGADHMPGAGRWALEMWREMLREGVRRCRERRPAS